jgi:tRNA (guanine-N7-)-methyltransferase
MTTPRLPIDVTPFLLPMPEAQVSWLTVFGNRGDVELEVGSGKGLFLANAAVARPDCNFLGIELSRKYAHKTAERLAKKALPNVKVIAGDARRFLSLFVPPLSLAAVHIYFPDPWWKKRHKKRRVFCEPFVADVARALRPGGSFWLATDVEEYFTVIWKLMAARPEFEPRPPLEPKPAEHDLDYLTNFERKYRIEGRAIFRASYRRGGPTMNEGNGGES